MWLWGIGGWVLGAITALCGAKGIWICTAAVEETVHRHLDEQTRFLADVDAELRELVLEIQREENAHLDHAVGRLPKMALMGRLVRAVIVTATKSVIWLSTWGDSGRLARELNDWEEHGRESE